VNWKKTINRLKRRPMKKTIYLVMAVALMCGCAKDASEDESKATGSLYGIVTDATIHGEPIRGASVQLSTGEKTTTGNDGQYSFSNLSAGKYTLNATKPGYKDLLNHEIIVEAGKDCSGDFQLEKLPPSLRVVNDSQQDISELDFGSAEADVARSFSVFNDGPESLEWKITKTATWISAVSETGGTLTAGATQAIIITIDRDQLASGENVTTVHITSSNGSKQLTVKATNGKQLPTLNTLDATNIAATTAIFNGEITGAGSPAYTERGFVYATTTMPTLENTIARRTVTVTGETKFFTDVLGLELGNTYFVRAYAINSVGTAYSTNEVSFTTATVLPTLTTDMVKNISIANERATFNGTILTLGDPGYTERGFVYGTVHNPTVEDDQRKIAAGNGTGEFSVNATELQAGNIYYIRAYATNTAGTAYGTEVTLDFNAIMPQVSTQDVTEITGATATFNGNITSVGDPAYTEKGFVYGALHNPTIEDNNTKPVSGTGTGIFNANITGLTTGTLLYVRAYAKTSAGVAYGEEVSFMPNNPNVVILPAAGLMVQKADINENSAVSWSTGNSLCENSTLDGYTDWRLPTKDELAVLYNERNTIGGFSNTWYWSSTASGSKHWQQEFWSGEQGAYDDTAMCRCVRTLP
jgi:hypothetical protein